MPRATAFPGTLKQLRLASGFTQEDVAERSGVSLETIRAYEQGKREPGSEMLARVAEVVAPGESEREELYRAAGREPPPSTIFSLFLKGRPEPETIAHQLAAQPWVSLVHSERHEIVGWNGLANATAEADLGEMLPNDWDRNLLWMASLPHFMARLTNWDELIGRLLWIILGEGLRIDDSQTFPPHFGALIGRLAREHPGALDRLHRLWLNLPDLNRGIRNIHPVAWQLASGQRLRFHAAMRDWSLYDGFFAFDWIAADEETSEWVTGQLEQVGYAAWAPIGSPVAPDDFPELLALNRAGAGLSQQELASRAGISRDTVYAYERGRRRPTREGVIRLSRAMSLDGMPTNRLLSTLGMPPEPSSHARWLTGESEWVTVPGRFEPVELQRDAVHAELQGIEWPCVLVNGLCHIEGANRAAAGLPGLGSLRLNNGNDGPHLLQFLLSPAVRERALNWPELARAVLPDTLRLQTPDLPDKKPPGAFQREVNLLRRSDPNALRALLEAWDSASSRSAPIRVATQMEWLGDNGEVLLFHCFLTRWNAANRYWAIDWHPANAAAWEAVRRATAGNGIR